MPAKTIANGAIAFFQKLECLQPSQVAPLASFLRQVAKEQALAITGGMISQLSAFAQRNPEDINNGFPMARNSSEKIHYVHAADLHLDRPFLGLPAADPAQLAELRETPFQALRRIIAICESERPDFLVISGDIYDQEEHGIKPQLALRDACEKLASLGIPVFIAHGNHDPLSSVIHNISWPENVTIFSQEAWAVPVSKNGRVIAYVHGISHAANPETSNLATRFKRLDTDGQFQLGVLHCAVGAPENSPYAPCQLKDLQESGLDAWALGHIHSAQTISESPFIAYSGTPQGSHVNESGPKGCLSVTAENQNGIWRAVCGFRPTSPLVWENLNVDVGNIDKLDEIETKISMALENCLASMPPGTSTVIARVRLVGRTPLHATLKLTSTITTLLDRLQGLESRHPAVYVKDLQIETRPMLEGNLAQRADLLGEIARIAEKLEENPEELLNFADKVATPLSTNAATRKYIRTPDEDERKQLLRQAVTLCQEYLEIN